MSVAKLLIANRGEIAIRIAKAAAELAIQTVGIFSEDDALSLHTRRVDDAIALKGKGASAYLDIAQILQVAKDNGCDAIHPGYGFLSENAEFVRACEEADITFVGPARETIDLFGDKARARELAQNCQVPVIEGTSSATSLEEARSFFAQQGDGGAIMIKAIAGGGGRGIRAVTRPQDLDDAYNRCRSEALSAFGNAEVYVERLITRARHIEVQIVGDGTGAVQHLGERECSIQRRNQKLIEIAPCPDLGQALRDRIIGAAMRMAKETSYRNIGTFEFLVDADDLASGKPDAFFAFIEANPRLQVEHTVTEEVMDVDLVHIQLKLAAGDDLASLNLSTMPTGHALQLRVNMETMSADGEARPSGGTIESFEMPSGRGVRVDSFGYAGYRTSPSFDSLLGKIIVHARSGTFRDAVIKAVRALDECHIDGIGHNVSFLRAILQHEAFQSGAIYTSFVDEHAADLFEQSSRAQKPRHFERDADAVQGTGNASVPVGPEGTTAVLAPLQGSVFTLDVEIGQKVHEGEQVLIMDSMKMEHVITASTSGTIREIAVEVGEAVYEGHPLLFIEPGEVAGAVAQENVEIDLDAIRPDLAEVHLRHHFGQDVARPEAVAKRRKTNQRTARENIEHLCDEDSFVEYGPLVIAAQRRRRDIDDLIRRTPADGMVTGVGAVNGDKFGERASQCVVMSYDYMVLAGTQGMQNHRKKDRMFEIAKAQKLPVVIFTEGGGGRPGDTDAPGVAGLDCLAFNYFAGLSGLVPLVGVNSGRCFAGNAALLGCCDVIIATENSSIGMGGPAMIEGGGLGIYTPDEVGPMATQVPNGVVDILVRDEAEAVDVAKTYLSYFQGAIEDWDCADQRILRTLIPENRLRVYDIRTVIEGIADTDSVLELREKFGVGMITSLARIEGRPVGIIANNPVHLGGGD